MLIKPAFTLYQRTSSCPHVLSPMTTQNLDSIACPASCCFACNGLAFAQKNHRNLHFKFHIQFVFVFILSKRISAQECGNNYLLMLIIVILDLSGLLNIPKRGEEYLRPEVSNITIMSISRSLLLFDN